MSKFWKTAFLLQWGLCLSLSAGDLTFRQSRDRLTKLTPAAPLPASFVPCAAALLRTAQAVGVKAFLNSHPVIRVGVTLAPGFGHQMSSIHLVRRLRQSGYEGEIQLVYEQYSDERLSALVPGFKQGGDPVQSFPERKLVVVSLAELQKNAERFPEVGLGMQGAQDESQNFIPLPGRPFKPSTYRVRTLMRLQPANWAEGHQAIESIDGRRDSLEDLKPLQYAVLETLPVDVVSFLSLETTDAPESPRYALLQRLLSSAPTHEVAAFYNAHTNRLSTLNHYVDSIREAMEQAPHLFLEGAIVPVVSELTDYNMTNLKRMLSENPRLKDRVTLFDAQDPIWTTGKQPEVGQIWIVRVGNLPPPVSRALYEKSGIPPALTGLYSRNQMLRMGRPYLEVQFFDLRQVLNMPPKVAELFQSTIFNFIEEIDLGPNTPKSFKDASIANFILLSRSEQGAALREAYRVKAVADPLADDKFWQAILRLMAWTG
jgi:hypothetical protein